MICFSTHFLISIVQQNELGFVPKCKRSSQLAQIYCFTKILYLNWWIVRLCVSGIKCPVCSKFVLPDDIECHLVMCLTKPRLSYNGKKCVREFLSSISLTHSWGTNLQRTFWPKPRESVWFASRNSSRATPSPGYPASAYITSSKRIL
jgi:hypothetical protein